MIRKITRDKAISLARTMPIMNSKVLSSDLSAEFYLMEKEQLFSHYYILAIAAFGSITWISDESYRAEFESFIAENS